MNEVNAYRFLTCICKINISTDKQSNMKSPLFIDNLMSLSIEDQEQLKHNGQKIDIKPWNSYRLTKFPSSKGKNTKSNIFSLSKRTLIHVEIDKMKYDKIKKAQSPQKVKKYKSNSCVQESLKVKQSSYKNLDDFFEQNLQKINYHRQFRTSAQQRKSVFLLRPYIKSNFQKTQHQSTFQGMDRLKTQLYRRINSSQIGYTENQQQKKNSPNIKYTQKNNGPSVIQYMTEYSQDFEPSAIEKKTAKNNKRVSMSVLKQKLKNQYKQSKYVQRMQNIKKGKGMPITIIQ